MGRHYQVREMAAESELCLGMAADLSKQRLGAEFGDDFEGLGEKGTPHAL